MIEIEWDKEPETTTNNSEHGYLHYRGIVDSNPFASKKVLFHIRFIYKDGRDIWALEYLPTNRIWTRDGIAEHKTLQALAEHFLEDNLKQGLQ